MAGTFGSMDKPESRNVRKVVGIALPLIFLTIPSFWLMFAVPPLWRGVDAYNQTTLPPGMVTLLLHAPLYCTLSRLPLWLGYLISGAGPPVSLGYFIKHSQLTDAGVFALLVLQHVAVWWGALYLICAIARTLPTRLVLAVLFASQPLFYGFAHCVGSEALSMISILFLAGSGVRLMLRYPDIAPYDWIIFTVLLAAVSLTRHINCVLAAVLPIAMGIVMVERALRPRLTGQEAIASSNVPFLKASKVWLMSVAIGLIGLLGATSVTHLLCWRARTPWRSTFGYTFLWRLNFLQIMPPTSRQMLISKIASKCKLPESHQLLDVLDAWMNRNREWDPGAFIQEARPLLSYPEMKFHSEKFDRVLNEIASGFLYPPAAPLREVALSDFTKATRSSETDIVQFLFVNTDYFFSHREKMPQCSQLLTFRQPRERLIEAYKLSYFQWWNALSFRAWGIFGFVALLSALVVDYKRGGPSAPVILYAACLCIVGMAVVLLNCFFAQLQPRYILPMMELLLLSIIVLLGVLLGGCKSLDQ